MTRRNREALGGALIVLTLIALVIATLIMAWPSSGFEIAFTGIDDGSGEAFHGVARIEPASGGE
jgi:hypothetical protein